MVIKFNARPLPKCSTLHGSVSVSPTLTLCSLPMVRILGIGMLMVLDLSLEGCTREELLEEDEETEDAETVEINTLVRTTLT